ncbi:MAG: precorrin-3B C(17)-methyltransferase, partial [Desulfurivibrionaceae bacterium]|nr:precorrin-3B C(17)-methyltransferase [Desulfurivibrionaceae bacterium]
EMAREQSVTVDIEVIAGIAALNACAARLGAPLMHDFAAISLSDLLTPWEKIERRLEAAASADFVVVIYNPKSKKRAEHIVKAREILLAHRSPETPVGIVTAATRENERIVLTTLGKMLESEIDMQTTIIVGNSMTFAWQGFMVTPRGYAAKYAL